jgi:hypothetical protein
MKISKLPGLQELHCYKGVQFKAAANDVTLVTLLTFLTLPKA